MADDLDPPPFTLPDEIHPFVARLPPLIDPEKGMEQLDEAVKAAASHNIDQMAKWGIKDANTFLRYASGQLRWIPTETASAKQIYYTLCLFYFVLDQQPVLDKQTVIHPDSVDTPLTTVSQWISMYAMRIGDFMDTEASLTPESVASFEKVPEFNMQEAKYPEGGFKTFNQLFCRYLVDGARPIAEPTNDACITWPADSEFDGQIDVNDESIVSIVTVKSLDWPISALLRGSAYEKDFAGGTWMHAFLGPTDYHRQHAPIGGTVLEAKVIQGLCYLEVDVEPSKTRSGFNTLRPHRSWQTRKTQPALHREFRDTVAAPDTAGYQFIQTRGCIIIENDTVGKVAVLPIGMAYVSSVKLSVQSKYETCGTNLPTEVKKGDEISCFQFGGSDIVLVFQKHPGVKILAENKTHYRYGEKLAIAKTPK